VGGRRGALRRRVQLLAAREGRLMMDVLWKDEERSFCRLSRGGKVVYAFTPAISASGHAIPEGISRLVHAHALKESLDRSWALQPLELRTERGRTLLFVDYQGGEPLERLMGKPMPIGQFLWIAVALAEALGRCHRSGLVHKNIKPVHVIVDSAARRVHLTGFGIASRLPRERQSPEPPEFIAGTLPYMSPEQTGRVNRSIDSRSDLYSLGVTFYQMLAGTLPFTASDPMEWVHCHIARQPTLLAARLKDLPAALCAITMKLLAKMPEERYQTASGVESDLRRCLAEWEARGAIQDFAPGADDISDHLMLPEKLYGRDREIEALVSAFERTAAGGRPRLVLISGFSGVGKSAIVHELHKRIVTRGGSFAAGKFDQYQRDIPYATLSRAFSDLIRPLLGKSDADLEGWRDALREALGSNGLLMVQLVPELEHIIGAQPPVPDLPPRDAQERFRLLVQRFIGVFARPENPLALFLDDLQWLDAATLDLLEHLLVRGGDLRHLLLIGAYRDNETDAAHPLIRKLETMRRGEAAIEDIVLAPLSRSDLERMLADTLHRDPGDIAPLAQLVHEKTTGNPFFAIQFITTLADESLLTFDHGAAHWAWDLQGIRAKNLTDSVVELMVGKLKRLPAETQDALRQLACLGNSAGFDTLSAVCRSSLEEVHAGLWEAVRAGLVFRAEDSYRFLHDRVREVAYTLIPEEHRAQAHLGIGRLLAERTPAGPKRDEAIFEIVNQLNRGAHLIVSDEERREVAALNLIAGRRAKTATAYASALKYLNAGGALLSEESWERDYALIFSIEYVTAECEVLTAEMAAAEARLSRLKARAADRHDRCLVTSLQLALYVTRDRSDHAVDVFLDWLRRDGTDWARRPTREDAAREYRQVRAMLGERTVEELASLPAMTDPDVLATLSVFAEMVTPSWAYDEHLSSLVICRLVKLGLEHGNWDGSCFGYVWYAVIAAHRFGDSEHGLRIGQLGSVLAEKRGPTRYQARTYLSLGALVMPWARHPSSGQELVRQAFAAASRVGDLTFAAYSWHQLITSGLAAGDRLGEVQLQAQDGLAFAEKFRFGLLTHICEAQRGLIRALRGSTRAFGSLDDEEISELDLERRLAANENLALAAFFYWTRKLQARYFACDFVAAVDAAARAEEFLWISSGMFETAELRLYGSLAHAKAWNSAPPGSRQRHLDALTAGLSQLEAWARHNPATFETRAAMVGAELARIQGRILDAESQYEQAIRSARLHGLIHNEAVANELAGSFYAARGFERIADTYLKDARACYLSWGADAKVRQLGQAYPRLSLDVTASAPTSTILTSSEHLDVATVIKVSEAVAGEIVFEKLVDTLMRTAAKYAGADRGLLILPRDDGYRIEAEITTAGDGLDVRLRQADIASSDLPETAWRYVVRTKETVLLNDAGSDNPFSADEYFRDHKARSVLCVPILKQTRLLGVLYLENRLTRHVFTPARMAILKLIASEAAISIENAHLYRDLAEREGRIRRLVDANIIGITLWSLDGRITEANDAFLRMVGYDRKDIAAGHVSWRELAPGDLYERQQELLADLKARGSLEQFEWEFLRKDGVRLPVLVGIASFDEDINEGVAFFLDLTELKNATEALRKLQADLAHANRLATMGTLTASIAHEVNQPIGAAHNNARAALRFLGASPPDLSEVTEALECVVKETSRAGDIVARIRNQVRKTRPRRERIDLNDAIAEVIALVRGELSKHHVSVKTQPGEALPPVLGDRVELQQVVLNLVLNAIEAMAGTHENARELSISTEATPAGGVLVTVRDSGPGIIQENHEQIFESFYTTKTGGVGIGLSICRSIVNAHGGRLWVDAHRPPGAVFRFTLPPGPSGEA
jgi:PAS domain S-box-containing protein